MEYVYFGFLIVYGAWMTCFSIRSSTRNQEMAESLENCVKALSRANRSLDSSNKTNGQLRTTLEKINAFVEMLKQDNIQLKNQIDEGSQCSTKDLIQLTYDSMKSKKESA